MGEVTQINIKNRTCYFYNDITDRKHFEPNLLKIDKNLYKNIYIYYIGYITIKKNDDCESINHTVLILCICVLIMRMDVLEKMELNT